MSIIHKVYTYKWQLFVISSGKWGMWWPCTPDFCTYNLAFTLAISFHYSGACPHNPIITSSPQASSSSRLVNSLCRCQKRNDPLTFGGVEYITVSSAASGNISSCSSWMYKTCITKAGNVGFNMASRNWRSRSSGQTTRWLSVSNQFLSTNICSGTTIQSTGNNSRN